MPRVKRGIKGAKSKLFKTAKEAVEKGWIYSYVGRKQRKRNFRQLWITRIGAACRINGINYRDFMHGLTKAHITLNRKMLSEIAIHDTQAFGELVKKAQSAL
jgi:large subunit ribosomal protein L20